MHQTAWVQLDTVAVRRIVAARRLKYWWVAEMSGVHKTTLRRWLSGRISLVTTRHVEQLAHALNVHTDEIVLLRSRSRFAA